MDLLDTLYVSKSFVCIGNSLPFCFNCKYCRLINDWSSCITYFTMPSEINPLFKYLPVAVNLFYGDPMLQVDGTVTLLERLEKAGHKGPVIIITKGDFSRFPDRPFDLDLHIAFSTFGVEGGRSMKYDGVDRNTLLTNLEVAFKRNYRYKYSIEFRPIIYNVNDSDASIDWVLLLAQAYGLAIGYSGLQGTPDVVRIWEERNYNLKPYPGFKFGHKKSLSKDRLDYIKTKAKDMGVPIFSKTSCLLSYTHGLSRDYNAHYYRPNEVGCFGCAMQNKCFAAKRLRDTLEPNLLDKIPFKAKLLYKKKHTCILKKKGICEYPTADCSRIRGGLIEIKDKITTADVRVIKWLTGYTVDADFYESSHLSSCWES